MAWCSTCSTRERVALQEHVTAVPVDRPSSAGLESSLVDEPTPNTRAVSKVTQVGG